MQLTAQLFDLADSAALPGLLFGRASAAEHHGYAQSGEFRRSERRSSQFFERLHQCGSAAHGCPQGRHTCHTSDGGQCVRRRIQVVDSFGFQSLFPAMFLTPSTACAPRTISRSSTHIVCVSAWPQPYGQSEQYRGDNAKTSHPSTSIQRLHARMKPGHCREVSIWLPFHPDSRFPRNLPSANSSRPICVMRRWPPTRLTCSTTSNASCASAAVACGLNPASSPNATSREGTAATWLACKVVIPPR